MRHKTYTTEQFLKVLYEAAEFKSGFDKINEALVITDEDGVILFANEITVKRTGYSMEEIIGKTPGELWGNQNDKSFYEDMWRTIKTEKKPFYGRVTNKKRDGTYYGSNLTIYPILDKQKNIYLFLGIASDFMDAI